MNCIQNIVYKPVESINIDSSHILFDKESNVGIKYMIVEETSVRNDDEKELRSSLYILSKKMKYGDI